MQPRGEIKVDREDYFTYQQAAAELGRSVESIQKAVSAGILHPIRFPPGNTRYLQREEVEWFKDKPLSMAIAEAYQQLKEARERIAELENRLREESLREESSGALKLLLVLAVVGVGLGLLASSQRSDATRNGSERDEPVHSAYIKSRRELEAREDYPTMARELGSTLFDLARKEELTIPERRLIGELWKVLAMPSDEIEASFYHNLEGETSSQ